MAFFKRKNVRKNLTLILAAMSSCILFYSGNRGTTMPVEAKVEKTQDSDGVAMYTVPSSDKVFINGMVVPTKTETFQYTTNSGTMENIKVQSGEYVDKGYHMFSYRDASKEKEVEEKEKEIASLEKDIKELQENSAENRQQIIYLNNKVKDVKEEINELKAEIVTNVYAPFSGEIHIEQLGDGSGENSELTIMLDSKDFYLEGKVSEQDLSKVNTGTPVDIYLFSTKETVKGTVNYVAKRPESVLDEETRNANLSKYRVRIGFNDQSNLVNGYHAQAKINTSLKEIKIPVTAIITEGEKHYVLVDEMGIAKKREIKAKFAETDSMAVVTEGLSENEMIVENIKESKMKEGSSIYSKGSSDINF